MKKKKKILVEHVNHFHFVTKIIGFLSAYREVASYGVLLLIKKKRKRKIINALLALSSTFN